MANCLVPSVEKAYYLRVEALLVDGGTLVLRSLIENRYPGIQWNNFLNQQQSKHKVTNLRNKKVISQEQYDILYPQNSTTNTSKYDISLLVCVLRSLLYPLTPAYFWNVIPPSTDVTEQADIIRLSHERNKLAHSSSALMTKQEFEAQWTYLEQVLVRLSKNIPDLKENIESLKEDSIDPEREEELKEIIKMWEDLDKALQEEIQEVKSKVQEHDQMLKNIQNDSHTLKNQSEQMQAEAGNLATQVSKNADKIKNIEEDATKLQNQMMSHDKKIQNLNVKQIEVGSSSKELAEQVHKTDAKVTKHICDSESRLDALEQSSKDTNYALINLCEKQGISTDQCFAALRGGEELMFVCEPCVHRIPPRDNDRIEISLSSTYSNVTGNFDLGNLSSDVSEVTSTLTRGELDTEEDSSDEEDISRIPDVSIRVNSSLQEPIEVLQESIEDVAPGESFTEDAPVTYEVLMGASQRGKDILSDSIGYTYNVKERNKKSTVWWCSVRNNSTRCPARVRQTGSSFQLGGQEHNHAPVPSKKSRIIITQQSSQQASQQLFTAASGIVESVANEVIAPTDVEQPNIDYIVRVVNRKRQRLRPEDPKDLDFEVNEEFIPDSFYRGDVRVEGRRHLIFATDDQLRLLKSAKRWYLDGTFKVVREPFDNLMTIHAFVRRGDCAKQIPLMFALMSGRRTKDYVKILKKVGRLLDREVEVEDFVVDFEAAMWKALRHVFGNDVKIHGCVFHWGQAVWRQVQAKGLATEYTTKRDTYSYIRKLLCLPFLPPEHISGVFDSLVDIAPRRFDGLLDYMRATWFESRVWPVECWSIYGMSIRTNNDVEGWHRRLNGRAGAAPPFYLLIKLLADEGHVALRNVSLVTELQLIRYQRRQFQTMQGQIIDLWNKYSRGEVSATGLLKQISTKYKTSVNRQ